MTDTNDLLKQGIAALKVGQKAEARRLLERVVQQDKDNETAWLWLSGAMDTDRERIHCLRETLRINPNNQHARRGLEKLEGKVPISRPAQPVEKKPIQPLKIQTPPAREEKKHDAEPIQVALRDYVEGTKQCPYCAETIKAEAKFCRFCSRNLETGELPQQLRAQSEQPKILYKATREDRQDHLAEVISKAIGQGYHVLNRQERTATVLKPKEFNMFGCLVLLALSGGGLFLFGIYAALVGLALGVAQILWYTLVQKDKAWYIEAHESGKVTWNGRTEAEWKRRRASREIAWGIVVFVVLSFFCWAWSQNGG